MSEQTENNSSQPLVVLRGEYAVLKGEDASLATPNLKDGTALILFDEENHVTALAHLDGAENLKNNLDKILVDMMRLGARMQNIKCKLIGK